MKDATPRAIHRRDYQPPAFLIDQVDLTFELDEHKTVVRSRLQVARNPAGPASSELRLDGQDLKLLAVRLDGKELPLSSLVLEAEALRIPGVPDAFVLEIDTETNPSANKSLEGLYVSSGNFCTQCEAEGFRKITYFLDQPDVMARYTTRIEADRARFPVLLSNGNLQEQGELDGGRHYAVWQDPFKKPCYLFALVAGQLVRKDGTFTTRSGREVTLHIYVEDGNLDKTDHCLASLIKAMKWDEEVYGREYDLDIFQIVAVGDFNMGAMENKGLNVFNTKYVLARPETATDADFLGVEGVVAHEYFHNWSGNRVTCRDWFQLSLKEGFTVFRDQEFSADMGSRAVKRISDVQRLRASQFPEDAGPTAHPVRPDSYVEINNFYTVTVYEKGAEVVRMFHTLLGKDTFRRATDLYFERHDGQAVTCDDFAACMAEASGRDLEQFKLWYSQAGTPLVEARYAWDEAQGELAVTLRQTVPPTPGQPEKAPMHIPVRAALLGAGGKLLPMTLRGESGPGPSERLLELRTPEETFTFTGLAERPVPSLLRDFSAPVKLDEELSDDDLRFRMAHDPDAFCRWDASQTLATAQLLEAVAAFAAGRTPEVPTAFVETFGAALAHEDTDPALLALALALPGESLLAEEMEVADPDAIHAARDWLREVLGKAHQAALTRRYEELHDEGAYSIDKDAIGRRMLKNLCLSYLTAAGDDGARASAQLERATNMTDELAALGCLTHLEGKAREDALHRFYERWQHDALVMDKWFAIQAISSRTHALDDVERLLGHPRFSLENPNKVRSLVGAFAANNPVRFHDKSGAGYRFLADRILELDAFNPQIAARLVGPLARWRRVDDERASKMKQQLQRLLDRPGVSKDVFEIASKGMAG